MKRKRDMLLSLMAAALLMGGCAAEPNPDYTPAEPEAPIEIDRTAFARGADISWVTQLESEGNTFATADGVTMEYDGYAGQQIKQADAAWLSAHPQE